MASMIPASKLSSEARELADDIGPYARAIAQRLGYTFETLTPGEAAAVRKAADDPEVVKTAGQAFGSKAAAGATDGDTSAEAAKARLGDAEAPASSRGPADVRADLDNPPAVQGPRGLAPGAVDAEYIEPPNALAVRSRLDQAPDFMPGAPPPDERLGALPPAPSVGQLPPPETSPGINKKLVAGAALAAGGAAAALMRGEPAPVQDAAKSGDQLEVTDGMATEPKKPPVNPAGSIEPGYVTSLPKWLAESDNKLTAPNPDAFQTIVLNGKKVNPIQYMADAEQRLVAETNGLAEQYKSERDTLKQRELFEGIVNAIGHLAAGWYGKHYGLDMSGTKFDVTDWVAQGEALRRHYDALSGMAKDKYAAAEKTGAAGERSLEQSWQRNAKLYEFAAKALQERNDNSFKEWQGTVKDVEIKNQTVHWSQELKVQEDRIDAELARSHTAADAKAGAAALKQLAADKEAGRRVSSLVAQAVNARDTNAGMVMLSWARELNTDLATRGRNVLPSGAFIDKRAGNSAFQFGLGADKPGLAAPTTVSKQLVDAENGKIQGAPATTQAAPVQSAATPGTAPAPSVSPVLENGVKAYMQAAGVDRPTALQKLKAVQKLPADYK
jgi:hypothetical protein